ncbi:MAG: dihydropteroate synthase [Saprospiraceae bacterium]|nr:dihydropteroate synthase [Candidatus Vicinibacter affinis]MBP6173611.1 dihydropteroate synthase [Saprospiraceae bacterium]MBK7798873.1 dihydropteroate synthase [Candidatus Vicinibacter affinis]MBK9640871.1 dihydropteroate synthase [Candidatus Vicinibacter affinis]MBP6521595.1 dihydropteroate synthase [Saprospiraceae bacterium]
MSNFAAFTKSNHTFLEGLVFRGLKDNPLTSSSIFNISGRLVKLEYPAVMSIINLSPDSFYSTSSVTEEEQIEIRIREMIGEGVDILDIGAASSKPGSKAIPVELETERIAKAVKIARQISPEVLISVDTYRASVAAKALELGASMINDISAGLLDEAMVPLVQSAGVPYIIMHMRGTPEDMNNAQNLMYNDLAADIIRFFAERIHFLHQHGIHQLIIDPGFGFSKNVQLNFELLRKLSLFQIIETPILVGLSRKSMIFKTLHLEPGLALNGSTAAHMIALMNGADILRVHDVAEARETIAIFKAYKNQST